MSEAIHISAVVPVRDEQENVTELCDALREVLTGSYEVIFIDDGSIDLTWEKLKALHVPGCIRLLRLGKPCGKTAALCTGFEAARGEVIFTLDGDLQDDPREIPRFLDALSDGSDMVCGWKKRRHDPLDKVAVSRIFNLLVRCVTGMKLHDINCGFKAFRGDIARSLRFYGEMHRFLPLFVAAQGYKVTEIEVIHHPRKHGRSKYGTKRLLKGCVDLVTALLVTRFRDRPAHGFGVMALILAAFGVLTGSYWLMFQIFPWLVISSLFWVFSAVFMAAGWVAEMLLAMMPQASNLPENPVAERLD